MTWISIGIICSSRTTYLPSLKLLGQRVLELSVAQGEVDWHDHDLDLWPNDLNINRDHLLTEDYLPTKFEASGAKRSWIISCTRLRQTDIPTDGHVQSNMPLFLRRGHTYESSTYSCSWVIGKVKVFVHADADAGGTTIALRTFVTASLLEPRVQRALLL